MENKVPGPGCKKCESAKKDVGEAVTESGLDAMIIKVTRRDGDRRARRFW